MRCCLHMMTAVVFLNTLKALLGGILVLRGGSGLLGPLGINKCVFRSYTQSRLEVSRSRLGVSKSRLGVSKPRLGVNNPRLCDRKPMHCVPSQGLQQYPGLTRHGAYAVFSNMTRRGRLVSQHDRTNTAVNFLLNADDRVDAAFKTNTAAAVKSSCKATPICPSASPRCNAVATKRLLCCLPVNIKEVALPDTVNTIMLLHA